MIILDSVFNFLTKDYLPLIGLDGIGFYCYLVRLDRNNFSKMITIEFNIMPEILISTPEHLMKLINKLEICELLEVDYKKTLCHVKPLNSCPQDSEKQLYYCDKLFDNFLITEEEKVKMVKEINIRRQEKNENFKRQPKIREAVEDIELLKPSKIAQNPNNAVELVKYYYRLLSKEFNGDFHPANFVKEGSLLKKSMRKNGDTHEDVKRYFKLIIEQHKRENNFDAVSTMGLYGWLRNKANYHINKESIISKEIVNEKDKKDIILQEITEAFNYYISDGETVEESIQKLRLAYKSELVDNFLKTLENENG